MFFATNHTINTFFEVEITKTFQRHCVSPKAIYIIYLHPERNEIKETANA